jgi:outer membrane receptor for ferrienterochelin and colicins
MTVLAGIRFDKHSSYGEKVSPKLAMMFSPTNMSRIRLSYSEGFRAPSFKELYLDYTNISVNYHIQGNKSLKPEKSKSYSADFEIWDNEKFHLRSHFFYNKIMDIIDYHYLGIIDSFGTYKTSNLRSAETWGIDSDIEYFPIDEIKFKIGYGFLDTWNEQSKNPLPFKSKHKINSSINLRLHYDYYLSLKMQYFGKKFYWENSENEQNVFSQNETNKEWIPDFFLFHTNFSFPIYEDFEGSFGIRNLTNYVNKNWGPMPGREWYLRVSYKFEK